MSASNSKKGGGVIRLVSSVIMGLCAAAAVLLLSSLLISKETLPPNLGKLYTIAALIAGAGVSSHRYSSFGSEKKLISALISAAAMEAITICAGLILGKGRISAGAIPYQLLCVVLGSITGCIITLKRPHRRRR